MIEKVGVMRGFEMTDVTLEYVVELAEQLTPADQFALVEHLQLK